MKTTSVTIPMRSIWSSLIALAILGFTYIQVIGYIIPGFEEIFKLTKESTTIENVGLMWVPVISYILICGFICMIVRIFKDLKPYKEKGLIWGLIGGLIWGLIWGLIVGLIGGLIWGLIWGLKVGLIVGLIGGLIWWGLIVGLIVGLIEELK